ncbi:hypothetical protein [Palleronia sp. LCG004]|uniref:hypothetical protein n=1 Tax=Palleronia sp. LCG004 TaxID=3079304 RepID=UPI002941CE0E|nr:hypothetical protein [Palleronia sp. LCG004]WOI57138.1 hypothetical protein RVY76_04930 [Palleronia sp. LCG004]
MNDNDPDNRRVDREAGEDMKHAAERLRDDAQTTAESLGARAQEEAYSRADRAKSGIASEISGFADALRRAADDMRSGSPQEKSFGQIAGALADASDAVRDRDLGQLAGDASDFARRNPLAFLGGAALAGFAVSRFAKASASAPRGGYGSSGSHDDFGSYDRGPRGTTPTPTTPTPPSAPVDRSAVPGPATTPVTTTPGTGTPSTGMPSPNATRTPGDV